MIDIDDDLAEVFYSTDDFAQLCTPVRSGVPGVQFPGILAVVDEDLFDGQVQAGTHGLQFPSAAADLLVGDTLHTQRKLANGSLEAAQLWRVLRTPFRVVDGSESTVWLTPLGGV